MNEDAIQNARYLTIGCILENMILTATQLEIGSVFLTGLISAISNNSKILNEIGVSEEYELAASVAFGIPNMEPIEKNLSENRFSIEYNE